MSNPAARWATDPTTVQSVDRAVTVLEILARDGECGVTQIAAELGVHKSTAFRLVTALENRGLVEQRADRGKYRLGVGILRLAGATAARMDVVQEGRDISRALAAEVGETINISILADGEALYLDQVAGPSALQPHNWVGQRTPLHATSSGKVLLAFLPGDQRKRLLAVAALTRFTDHTITDPEALERDLAAVRANGYATAVDELEAGLTAVAAPIRNADGQVVAALSASGPSFRLRDERLTAVTAAVRLAAERISWRLGWSGA